MYFLFSVIPAAVMMLIGYLVLFCSSKAEGAVKTMGQILAAGLFVVVAALPLAGAYASYAGFPTIGEVMESMHAGGSIPGCFGYPSSARPIHGWD